MTKQELRKFYREKRIALSEGEHLSLNYQLCENFFAHIELSFFKVVHCFLPLTEKREPDTWLIIDRIRREFPAIRLSLPRVNPATDELENIYFEGFHQLKTNAWGISEPAEGIPTPLEKIDMVLVPLLAFDVKGNRVGYGKGYYDRFLLQCPSSTQKIGLSLFSPEQAVPNDDNDVPLDSCITPGVIYTF
jgi:5-formyltetrahydrofolate cyclo-ligase